jgi:Tfp pilus assembly protein PilN
MRPVNLIPPEERPGGRKPLRSGPVAYILVGALALAVIAIVALLVTEGKVNDRKAEVTQLEAEQTTLTAKAQSLAAYTQFADAHEARLATITELADSRFDWARILHELSLVIPPDVRLTNLTGSGASGAGGGGSGMRAEIAGPALELSGCTTSQSAVAGFIEAMKNIDGVTRVGVPTATQTGESGGNATTAGTCGGNRNTQFQAVIAFDAAPAASFGASGELPPEEASTESTEEGSSETTSSESSEESAPAESEEGAS